MMTALKIIIITGFALAVVALIATAHLWIAIP